jgi:endonuclease YncB( thermonuclease family)
MIANTQVFDLYAKINEVYDGDTLYGWIDHGCGLWNHGASKAGVGLRLFGCNAIELHEPGGQEAQQNLASLIPVGSYVPIISRDWDKYSNRLDVDIITPAGIDLVPNLIQTGWAAAWNGVGPRPVPVWPRA